MIFTFYVVDKSPVDHNKYFKTKFLVIPCYFFYLDGLVMHSVMSLVLNFQNLSWKYLKLLSAAFS